jgi:TolB-like protein
MKRSVLVTALLLSAGLCFSQAKTLDQAAAECASYFGGRLPARSAVTLLPVGASTAELSRYVTQKLSLRLVNDGRLLVVERREAELQAVEREITYQLQGNVSDESALSLGKQLGAELVLYGTITRDGGAYLLNVKAIQVETSVNRGEYAASVRSDPAWSSLDRIEKALAIAFAGDELSGRDKQSLEDGVQAALDAYSVPLFLDTGDAAPDGYALTVTVYSQGAAANNGLLQGEFSLKLSQGRRILRQAGPYRVTETSMALLIRRGAERIRADKAFFQALADIAGR